MRKSVIVTCLLATLALVGCTGGPRPVVDTVTVPSATAPLPAALTPAPVDTAMPVGAVREPPPSPAGPTSVPDDRPPRHTATPAPFAALPDTTAFPCPPTPTPQVSARPLRFAYLRDGQVWLWKEEAGQATLVPVQHRPDGIAASSDGRLIAYRAQLNATQSEVWVISSDGTGERRLAAADSAEVPDRYPGTEQYYGLSFAWVPGTHLLTYSYVRTCCGEGYEPLEITRFVDADTGALRFTIAGGEVDSVRYAPGGRRLAALTASELRLIDTADGQVIARYPVQSRSGRGLSMAYSPDGRWLVAVTKPGFTVVDTKSGSQRDIPFAYQPYGMGGWSLYPPVEWLGDGPVFYTVFSTDRPETVPYDQSRCTVWRIDAGTGTVTSVYEYTGGVWVSELSPDRRWLIYRQKRQERVLDLYLADLSTGRALLYDTDERINAYAWGWAPDGQHFAYNYSASPRLASVCEKPVPIAGAGGGMAWLDGQRYIGSAQGGGSVAYSLRWLSGKALPIVTLPEPSRRSEPPYESSGPAYAYFLSE